jgi:hypothetical protein
LLQAYDGQGWHRTGTEVDAASAAWFGDTLRNLGAKPALEEFTFPRVEPVNARLEIAGRSLEGLPIFDSDELPGGSLNGALGPLGSDSPIGLVVTSSPAPDPRYDAMRRDCGHRALVAVTVARAPGLQARNAGSFKSPFGVPVLQVGSEHEEFLRAQAEKRGVANLSLQVQRVPAQSSNVVARVPGADPSLAPIVVSTPRTGWWNCSGERGGGIACWSELLRDAIAEPYARDAIFVAFAGHELDHLGLDDFLERRPRLPISAHAWVHFGANVGAAKGPAVRLSASTAPDLQAARAALETEGVSGVTSPQPGTVNGGESAVVASLGARCIALLGGNDLFHLESDRWPAANDVPQIARQARAFTAFVRNLAAGRAAE